MFCIKNVYLPYFLKYYSRGDIIQEGTLFKEIRYLNKHKKTILLSIFHFIHWQKDNKAQNICFVQLHHRTIIWQKLQSYPYISTNDDGNICFVFILRQEEFLIEKTLLKPNYSKKQRFFIIIFTYVR